MGHPPTSGRLTYQRWRLRTRQKSPKNPLGFGGLFAINTASVASHELLKTPVTGVMTFLTPDMPRVRRATRVIIYDLHGWSRRGLLSYLRQFATVILDKSTSNEPDRGSFVHEPDKRPCMRYQTSSWICTKYPCMDRASHPCLCPCSSRAS